MRTNSNAQKPNTECTLAAIAARFGVGPDTIQRQEQQALRKMRREFEKMAREEGLTVEELLEG